MNNWLKYFLYGLLFTFILLWVLFSWIMWLMPDTIATAKIAIEYMPLEFRITIFLIFGGLILALGKSFFN